MAEPGDRAITGDDGDVDHRADMEFRLWHGLDTSEVNAAVHFVPLDLHFGLWKGRKCLFLAETIYMKSIQMALESS